jgi:hypothetical protein
MPRHTLHSLFGKSVLGGGDPRAVPGTLRGTHGDYERPRRSVEASAGSATRSAEKLAARLARDGIGGTRAVAIVLSYCPGVAGPEVLALVGRALPAPASDPPAPTRTLPEELAAARLAEGESPSGVTWALSAQGYAIDEATVCELAKTIARPPARGAPVRATGRPTRAFADGEGQPILNALTDAGTDEEPKPVWVQLARQGSFAGHPQGKPFRLDLRTFNTMIANFRANKDGELPIDFEHASEQDPTEGSIPSGGAPAQGWIVDLAIRDDGNLYALVQWGALARQYIREGKYKFISPAFHLQSKNRETGEPTGPYLSSAALTNQPFLDGMQPLAARATALGFTGLTAKLMTERSLSYAAAQAEASEILRGVAAG